MTFSGTIKRSQVVTAGKVVIADPVIKRLAIMLSQAETIGQQLELQRQIEARITYLAMSHQI